MAKSDPEINRFIEKGPNLSDRNTQNEFFMRLSMGGADGVIIILFVASALAYIQVEQMSLITICLIIMLLTGIIMGFSGYLASIIEKNHFRYVLDKDVQKEEIQKERTLLQNLNINETIQEMAFHEMEKDRQHWAKLMGDMDIERYKAPRYSFASGWKTGSSYLIGGAIPLLPYIFTSESGALTYSVMLSLAALMFLGYFKSSYIQTKPFTGVLNAVLAGLAAWGGAYVVGQILGMV